MTHSLTPWKRFGPLVGRRVIPVRRYASSVLGITRHILCLTLGVLALASTPASASGELASKLKATIIDQPGAPLKLDYCEMWSYRGTVEIGLDFEFPVAVRVAALRFGATLYDGFGAKVDTVSMDVAGGDPVDIPANKRVRFSGEDPNRDGWDSYKGFRFYTAPPSAVSAACFISKVRFADGTTWEAPAN